MHGPLDIACKVPVDISRSVATLFTSASTSICCSLKPSMADAGHHCTTAQSSCSNSDNTSLRNCEAMEKELGFAWFASLWCTCCGSLFGSCCSLNHGFLHGCQLRIVCSSQQTCRPALHQCMVQGAVDFLFAPSAFQAVPPSLMYMVPLQGAQHHRAGPGATSARPDQKTKGTTNCPLKLLLLLILEKS